MQTEAETEAHSTTQDGEAREIDPHRTECNHRSRHDESDADDFDDQHPERRTQALQSLHLSLHDAGDSQADPECQCESKGACSDAPGGNRDVAQVKFY